MSARLIKNVIATALIALCSAGASAEIGANAGRVQASWDQISFGMSGEDQKEAMLGLVEECQGLTATAQKDAELLTWCGIANSTYAGMASALSAMKYAKAAPARPGRALADEGRTIEIRAMLAQVEK